MHESKRIRALENTFCDFTFAKKLIFLFSPLKIIDASRNTFTASEGGKSEERTPHAIQYLLYQYPILKPCCYTSECTCCVLRHPSHALCPVSSTCLTVGVLHMGHSYTNLVKDVFHFS
jgi:hypothetical protein